MRDNERNCLNMGDHPACKLINDASGAFCSLRKRWYTFVPLIQDVVSRQFIITISCVSSLSLRPCVVVENTVLGRRTLNIRQTDIDSLSVWFTFNIKYILLL